MNKKTASFLITTLVSGYVMADPLTVTTLAPDKPAAVAPSQTAFPPPQLPAVNLASPGTAKPGESGKPPVTAPIAPAIPAKPVPVQTPKPTGLHITPIMRKSKKVHKANPDDDMVAPFFDIPENRGQSPVKKPETPTAKQTRPYEVTLPGLGRVNGDPMLMKAVVLRVNGDGTEVVQISSQFQNRISTPFETPKIIDSSDTEFKISGSNIFLSTPSDHPVVVYVTGSERNDPVLSLTLVPKPIPAQTIILQLDPSIAVRSSPAGRHEHKPETYEQHLSGLLKTLAGGDTPEGFTTGNISNIVGRKGPMIINPVSRYSNAYLDIFVYQAQNAGNSTINLSETGFYQKGVRAVGMYPLSTLRHAEKTYVYVISDKTALEAK